MMFKMEIPVILSSLKAAKDAKSSNYADFLYTGGSASIPVDDAAFAELKDLEGQDFVGMFQMKPRSVTLFGRATSVFEFQKFIAIVK